jgi:hypothetical protein
MITEIEAKIVPIKHSLTGHPVTEVLITGRVDGVVKHWLSRYWWVVTDSPHGRAAEIAAFKKRQGLN